MSTLTAIIPIGNTNGRIFALDRILRKCHENDIKVVLIHDDFQDGTGNEIDFLQKVHPWIEIISGIYRAPGKARNAGMNLIQTEWFCFWDADDEPNIENITNAIKTAEFRSEILVGHFTTQDYVSKELKIWPYPQEKKNIELDLAINPGLWRFLFKTASYGHCRFEDFTMGEDQLFLAEARINFERVQIVRKHFYTYVINQTNQLTSDKSRISQLNGVIQRENEASLALQGSQFIDFLILKQSLTLTRYRLIQGGQTIKVIFLTAIRLRMKSFEILVRLSKNKGGFL